ncbi:hypothetical protein [Parendozoicomonas sp. Alg238-R29]|uniref:hypothetical protein n=1 Tax=Parendozoicomonas sp. Alg238-R29 TaxID=2993446 RepID=UPI00248D7673|nr:hypothetical protein [Parendozoicomonas sp. Alg238-R29]
MSKYLYSTVYEEFTGLKPPEPTDNKQRRKRGYGHPYRMRLNMQEETEAKQKKPERRNQFGQPINSVRKGRDEQPQQSRELPPQFNAARPQREERREPRQNISNNQGINNEAPVLSMPTEHKSSSSAPKVTYKKRRQFTLEKIENVTTELKDSSSD